MKHYLLLLLTVLVTVGFCSAAEVVSSSVSRSLFMDTTVATNHATIARYQLEVPISYSDSMWCGGTTSSGASKIMVDGEVVLVTDGEGVYEWRIAKAGSHSVSHEANGIVMKKEIRVVGPEVVIEREGDNLCKLTATDGVSEIRYTTDGSEPTKESMLYTGPFMVSMLKLTFIRACTFGDGQYQGQTALAAFNPVGASIGSVENITAIDTRTGKGTLTVDGPVDVTRSCLWASDESADVVVEADGKTVAQGCGEGVEQYYPSSVGLHVLTHTTYKNGQVVGEPLSATLELSPTLKRGLVLDGRAVIADGTTEIGDGAFAERTDMTDVEISASVTNIASTAFAGCVNLTNVVLHGGALLPKRVMPGLVSGSLWLEESETVDGDRVYRSNGIGHVQSTAIEFDIPEGADRVVFSWKVESEQYFDWLTWYLDGVQKGLISGSREWDMVINDLNGAAHRLKFVYSKDVSGSSSSDCGWVSVHASGNSVSKLIDLFPDSPIAAVTISDEIVEIPEAFFANCTTMRTVVLSGSVTNIGANAFSGCENLKRVDVASLEDWLKIEFANETANPLYYGASLYVDGVKVQGYSRLLFPIVYENLCGSTHTNPGSYQEGSPVMFMPPSGRTGYTFAGWTPAAITADMTGAVTVSASWTANGYSVKYHANGGSGTMDDTAFTYDVEGRIGTNCFVRSGFVFAGWATEENGPVVYEAGQKVSNLTSNQNGVIELYAVWEVEVIAAPTVTPSDGAVFTTESCLVTLSCANEGAVIYYSTKGTPRRTAAYLYSGPFEITDTTTIKALAVKGDAKSEYVTATITKRVLTLSEVIDATNLVVTTGGDASWIPVVDSAAKTAGECAVSGAMEAADDANGNESWMEVSVNGPGTLTFWWKVDCEWADSGDCSWDRLMYFVDGADVDEDRIDGFVDWEQKTVTFTTPGTHSVRWVYHKDDYDEEDAVCADCGWVDGVVWTPSAVAATETTTTPVPVKYAWLEKYYAALSGASAPAYESKAFEKGANGLVVWESYVAGLDPTDEKSKFTASITMGCDGKPVITWVPDLSEASGAERRVYKTLGKAGLGDKYWTEVNDANRAGMRFFKVTVELP